MMISGFLMASIYLNRPEPLMKFYARRAFRLLPVFILALAAVYLMGGTYIQARAIVANGIFPETSPYSPLSANLGLSNIIFHLSFLSGLLPLPDKVLLPDWSLSLEVQFYLLLPTLFILFRRFGAIKSSLLITLLCLPISIVLKTTYLEPSLLPMKLPVFMVGILLAYALNETEKRSNFIVAAMGITLTQVVFYDGFNPLWLTAFALMNAICIKNNLSFNSKLVRFFANTSYAVYLMHGIFIGLIGQYLTGMYGIYRFQIMWLTVGTVSYGLGYLIYKYIEKPCIDYGKRLLDGVVDSASA